MLDDLRDILPVDLFDPVDAQGDRAEFARLNVHDFGGKDSRTVGLGNP